MEKRSHASTDFAVYSDAELDQLIKQAHKLTVLEALSVSAAHEINNAMSVVLLATENNLDERLKNKLEKIISVTKTLQSYGYPAINQLKPCQINECLNSALRICRTILNSGVSFTGELAEPLALVFGNPSELRQVMIDLILYAARWSEQLSLGPQQNSEPYLKWRCGTKECTDNIIIFFENEAFHSLSVLRKQQNPLSVAPFNEEGKYVWHMAEKIIQAHAGRLHCEMTDENGLRFAIHLPPQRAEENTFS